MKTFCCKSTNHLSKSTLNSIEQGRPTDLEETPDWLELRLRLLMPTTLTSIERARQLSTDWQNRRQTGGIKLYSSTHANSNRRKVESTKQSDLSSLSLRQEELAFNYGKQCKKGKQFSLVSTCLRITLKWAWIKLAFIYFRVYVIAKSFL